MVIILKHDLIIIGAGISGCICALSALKHDVENILIIEKSKIPGGAIPPKIDFAEDLGIKNILRELKLPIYNESNKSIWVSPGDIEFTFVSKVNDIWIKRGPSDDSFDSKMIKKLMDSGVDILFGTYGIKIKNNVVKTLCRGNIEKFNGKIFVDAGGFDSMISKNIPKPPCTNIIGFGFWGHDFDLEVGVPYIFFDQNLATGSYVLLNVDPKDKVGYFIMGTTNKKNANKKNLEKFIESKEILREAVRNASIKGHIFGHLYSIHRIPTVFQSDNLILVGDSARFMDPFLHYGIQPSIISGYLAGKSIGRYFNGEVDLTEYTALINKNLIKYLKKRILYRKIFDRLKNRDIDQIFELIRQFEYSGGNIDDLFENPKNYFSILSLGIKNVGSIFSLFKSIIKNNNI